MTNEDQTLRMRTVKAAEVGMKDNVPVVNTVARKPRTMSDMEIFANQSSGSTVSSFSFTDPEGGMATGQHTQPGRVLMWKPGADGRYVPRMVPDGNRGLNLRNGWLPRCPDCNTNHEQSPYPPSDPNSCPGRDNVAVRICPVCSKRIPDNMGWVQPEQAADAPDAESILRSEDITSTPATRTLMQLHIHLWERHPRQAQTMNIPPIPQGFANPALPPQQGVAV